MDTSGYVIYISCFATDAKSLNPVLESRGLRIHERV